MTIQAHAVTLSLLLLGSPLLAHATLGGAADTPAADSVHFQARRAVIARPGLTQHTLTTGDGTVVKEFVNASGQVFAVSWQGPWRPDLSRLLGAYYKDYLSQGASPQGTRTRQAIGLTRSDLVIRTGGHPSAFWGQAYLPSGLPAGVNPSELN